MTIDCHIKIEGADGESTHSKHSGEIQLLSWGWSVHNAPNVTGGGMAAGKATQGELVCQKKYDKSSPNISEHCASGKHLKEVKVSLSLAGGTQEDFLIYTLKEAFISSHSVTASSGGEVHDSFSVAYTEVEIKYKPQKEDGSLGGENRKAWNFKTSKKA